jgi:sugar lactone lactonase YvrE
MIGLAWRTDGSRFYTTGNGNNRVYQYNCSSWDISTAAIAANFTVTTQDTVPEGVAFSDDGSKMFVVGSSSDKVHRYSLSTAWLVSSAAYDSVSLDVSGQETAPTDVTFRPDGEVVYVVGVGATSDLGAVHQYGHVPIAAGWAVGSVRF